MEQKKYIIAGIKTQINARKDWTVETQARDYLCEFDGNPEIAVGVSDEFIEEQKKQNPHLSAADCEYIWTGDQFCRMLLNFDGFMLHASAVVYEDKAYLFSAPSGTGKSTHTTLWCKTFGKSAYIINDDKPVLRIKDGRIMVYGTPWSGKTNLNRNTGVPLQGICFIERATKCHIKQISVAEALYSILNQTTRPQQSAYMDKLLLVLERVLGSTNIYKMGCDISRDAVKTAYEGMSGQPFPENIEEEEQQ